MTSHHRAMTTLVAAAIIGILAAGCGSDDNANTARSASPETSTEATEATEATSATGGDATLDPCRLVTAGEAAAVLGSDPGEPTNVRAGGVGACTYRLDGVGDQAHVNGTIGQIAVVQGDVLFAIFVMLPDGADVDHATLIELGRAAAGRL